jgi:large subunit ribosomal protein L21
MAESYAIIETGGKQYRAEKGTVLVVDRLSEDEGAKVTLRPVMFSGGDNFVGGGADLGKVKVEAEVVEHLRGEKIKVFKYKAKKGYRKRRGHRSSLTKLEVKDVKMLTRKPAATKAETAEKPAATKPAAKKPAAKAPAAKKPAAKAPAAKKPAAKKPAAKKPAAKEDPDGS